MGLSINPQAYADVRRVLDDALASERGVSVACPAEGDAINMVQRMHKCRVLDRESSTKIYARDDPNFMNSVYDTLRITRDGRVVKVLKVDAINIEVTPL